MKEENIRFAAGRSAGEVSAIFMRPENARWLMVLAHGAGAGMRHAFMNSIAQILAQHDIASFRYQFPYMEQGKRAVSPRPLLLQTVRAAVATAGEHAKDLPLLAGGKSMGGRMTSTAASQEPLPGVRAIVFFGFPLHAPGRPSAERGEHLFGVDLPMLFLQGTRDRLADLSLMRALCDRLQETAKADLHIVGGADHGFHVTRQTGRTDDEVLQELGWVVAEWTAGLEYVRT